jgi:glycosyltransferase involved in cell wall biosynthesis
VIDSQQPLVSIVTPSFNQAPFLTATLRSVAEQDYPAIEHIILDGASTDGSVNILRDWSAHPITWHSEPDDGQADAIRRGFAMAKGGILTWLNSDDIYLRPDAISKVVERMRAGARAVTGAGAKIDASGQIIAPIKLSPWLSHRALRCLDTIMQPATFFVRDLAEACPIDTSMHYAFDWDLFIRMSALAPFEPLDIPLAAYRLHGTGKTETAGYQRQRELLRIVRRYRGTWHPATIGLAAFTASYLLFDRLPPPVPQLWGRLLNKLAYWSNELSGGRGIAC